MQLLFEHSTEMGGAEGLGLLPGEVRELDAPGLKIPQIGWNAVSWRRESPLLDGLSDPAAFYHVHSFAPAASNGVVLGTADYGSEFVSAVQGDGVYGVQFHPEKSGPDGLRLLRNFTALAQ
jgi:glutamine amidotransferase